MSRGHDPAIRRADQTTSVLEIHRNGVLQTAPPYVERPRGSSDRPNRSSVETCC